MVAADVGEHVFGVCQPRERHDRAPAQAQKHKNEPNRVPCEPLFEASDSLDSGYRVKHKTTRGPTNVCGMSLNVCDNRDKNPLLSAP